MIEIKCDKCDAELSEPGGLVFSPPKDGSWQVRKYHVCSSCWEALEKDFKNGSIKSN